MLNNLNLRYSEELPEEKLSAGADIKKSPKRWLLLSIILISSALTVSYIYNARKVDELMVNIRKYEKRKVEIKESNDYLNYRMEQLMSAERIIPLASEKLNMIPAKEKPKVIETE